MPPDSDSTVVVTPVQGVGEGLSQEGRNGAHNHPTETPLTDDEYAYLKQNGLTGRILDEVVSMTEHILSARLDALHAENQRLRAKCDDDWRAQLMADDLHTVEGRALYAAAETNVKERFEPQQRQMWHDLEAERDAARAERDALRAAITALADEWAATDYRGPRPAEHYCAERLRALYDREVAQ